MSGSGRNQVAINLGFTLLKSVFVLLSIRLADVMLSAQMMGLVLLFRRQGALWSNLVQLGLSQVLLKYYTGSDDPIYRAQLWNRVVRWAAVAMLFAALTCLVFAAPLTPWLFPTAHPTVTAAFGVYVAGLALGFIANSSWLAEFRFVESNLIDWLHGSLLFVVCLLFASGADLITFSWVLALVTIAASVISLRHFAQHTSYRLHKPPSGWQLTRQERRYGFTRALSAYADMATMVIGPWMLRHRPAEAAQLIAAYTVLRIAQTLVMPVAQVLALRANSRLYDSGREEKRILVLCAFVFVFAWIGVAAYYLVGPWAVRWWLPNSSGGVIAILNVLMPYMPGICLFYALRSHVDLRFLFPWNLITLLLCMAVFLASMLVQKDIDIEMAVISSSHMFSVFYLSGIVFLINVIFRPKVKTC